MNNIHITRSILSESQMRKHIKETEFLYKEPIRPLSTSTSILGPTIRLCASFITLGISEDIHRKIKNTFITMMSKQLTRGPTKENRNEKLNLFKCYRNDVYHRSSSLSVQIGKKAQLNGMLIQPELESKKYVVWLNGLGGSYEGKLGVVGEYANDLNANVLLFNYRGTGDSTSSVPVKPKDLVTDTIAMIAYLTHVKGISPNDIVIHGFSLGGGVGAQAAMQMPGVREINDRSYDVFSKAAKELISIEYQHKIGKIPAKLLASLTAFFIRSYDLDLNTVKLYETEKRDTLILFHPGDLRLKNSSLKTTLERRDFASEYKFVDMTQEKDLENDDFHNTYVLNSDATTAHIKDFIHVDTLEKTDGGEGIQLH